MESINIYPAAINKPLMRNSATKALPIISCASSSFFSPSRIEKSALAPTPISTLNAMKKNPMGNNSVMLAMPGAPNS